MKSLTLCLLILCFCLGGIQPAAHAQKVKKGKPQTQPFPELTDEYIQKKISEGQKYTLVLITRGPKRDQDSLTAEKIQKEHLRYMFELRREGVLVLNGPSLEEGDFRGIDIFTLTNKEGVNRLMEDDPAVKAGRLSFRVYEWFGLPGDGLPDRKQ